MTVSVAPGKILFAGEFAGAFGLPLVATAVDLETRVIVEQSGDLLCHIQSDYWNNELVSEKAEKMVECWNNAWKIYVEKYLPTKDISVLEQFREGSSPVLLAIGAALSEINNPKPLNICITSTIPVGCGIGSSASMAVGIVGGIMKHFKFNWDLNQVNELAYKIEKVLNGAPNGGDNAGVSFGAWIEYGADKKTRYLKNVSAKNDWWLIDGGNPRETSLELIGKVITLIKNNPRLSKMVKYRYQQHVQSVLDYISDGKLDPSSLTEEQEINELLGIVGVRGRNIVAGIKNIGGYARVCGAGGVSTGAGSILAYCESGEKIRKLANTLHFTYQPIKLGGPGWHIEK